MEGHVLQRLILKFGQLEPNALDSVDPSFGLEGSLVSAL